MAAYYNEIDPYAAQWLRNLIDAGHITAGEVDERSIEEVQPDDLKGYERCHFFAGIAGWDLALNLAGWGDAPVWTGSCPCQPFSGAGQRKGADDERHLWPAFYRLVAECRPPTVFGEQVASKDGREWLAAVRLDLEDLGYACGAADLCAAGVGAPHIRQRLFWVANADGRDASAEGLQRCGEYRFEPKDRVVVGLAQPDHEHGRPGTGGEDRAETGNNSGLGDADEPGPQERERDAGEHADQRSPWEASEFIPCSDGKVRPTQSRIHPLAHGVPGRVGRLRAYGNAIVPQVAAEFVAAFLECRP